jgi:apolipoprotein N-acyltransferase
MRFNKMALADRIILSFGWRRRLAAFVAGAVGALAMAPFDLFPALIVPMVVAVWLIDGSSQAFKGGGWRNVALLVSAMEAARDGWWLGFGFFVAGLWWLGAACLVEPEQFAWALPLAVLGLPAVLALFMGLGFGLARLLWSAGPGRILALAFGLGVSEWLRGVVATGFPWNGLGMALGGNGVLAQPAALVGLYGLNVLAVLIFASPACLADGHGGKARSAGSLAPVFLGLGLLGLIGAGGALRLWNAPSDMAPGVRLRIMQPNLPQDDKFRSEYKDQILDRYLTLSDRATSPQTSGVSDATHLIWPESAFPFILSRDAVALGRIGAFLGRGTVLITGAARMGETVRGARLPGESNTLYYNSIQALANGGEIVAGYDKTHLVPFGEYLPFSGLLESFGLRHFVHIPGGFEPGARRRLLEVPGLPPAAALICYEAIFPGEAVPVEASGEHPGLLLNVTNDGWFGNTTGPHQHFAQARLRAVEEGLPLVRAANTGLSAVVDGYGRILHKLPLGTEGVIDSALPRPAPVTIFAASPLAGPLFLLLLCLLGAWVWRSQTR